jgi:hypothetical protein
MSDKQFIYLIFGIVILHIVFGLGFLIYKILKAPKRYKNQDDKEETIPK